MAVIEMVPMTHKMIPRYRWYKQFTNFLMDMAGKESCSHREMKDTFGIKGSKSNECTGAGEYDCGT
jgi:hypothetical protein